jgi:altronate dehydratase large subunit
MFSFMGYEQPDGRVGIRNHVVVISTVGCVNGTINAIARKAPGIIPLYHGHGCARLGEDLKTHMRALVNLCKNPNIASVLVISLGCEFIKGKEFSESVAACGKPVEHLCVQTDGGSVKVAEKGAEIAERMLKAASQRQKKEFGLDKIVLGLECGGSDALSGITANPAVGKVTDWLVEAGGTAILTEVTEMIGTAHILKKRGVTPEIGQQIEDLINAQEEKTKRVLGDQLSTAIISPGNMDGGMSTIREKSLGCICKAGSSMISEIVPYGGIPKNKGLIIMDGPGYDIESITGEAASGANIMIFTTGRGNPVGFPILPVIKVASNTRLYEAMKDDMDVNAGGLLEGVSLDDLGNKIIDLTKRIINGEKTKAEVNQLDSCIALLSATTSF